MWRTLEPYHGMIYFAQEAFDAYARIGLRGRRMGYFASRSAPMGPVPADVVIATFFNFHPDLIRRAIPDAWSLASPAVILDARLEAADAALRRVLGGAVASNEVAEAAAIAHDACAACTPEGRTLYAGHASLPWPEAPHLALWHATSLLREFRGDGHIAAMTAEGVRACEALVLHAATGLIPADVLQASRAWSDEEWTDARASLERRGWLAGDGTLTDPGRAHREMVEARTDELASAPWEHLGAQRCARLREIVRPLSKALVEAGTFLARWDED